MRAQGLSRRSLEVVGGWWGYIQPVQALYLARYSAWALYLARYMPSRIMV